MKCEERKSRKVKGRIQFQVEPSNILLLSSRGVHMSYHYLKNTVNIRDAENLAYVIATIAGTGLLSGRALA